MLPHEITIRLHAIAEHIRYIDTQTNRYRLNINPTSHDFMVKASKLIDNLTPRSPALKDPEASNIMYLLEWYKTPYQAYDWHRLHRFLMDLHSTEYYLTSTSLSPYMPEKSNQIGTLDMVCPICSFINSHSNTCPRGK